VEVAEGAEPAAADNDTVEVAPLSLKARLAAIRDDCDAIHKDSISKEKDGKKWTERGHIVEAILAEFRPLLTKHGVVMIPNLVERAYVGNRCDVLMDFTFERTDDSDEQRVIRWGGAGTDNGDKAFAKAGTNCLKELIKKAFLVTDRDDAKEEVETVEHQTEDAAAVAKLNQAKERTGAAIQQWAKTFKAALKSAQTEKDVDRLQRENKDQLTDDTLPDVTRTFFVDLIQERKSALAPKDPA
jgi:hypothetical protein